MAGMSVFGSASPLFRLGTSAGLVSGRFGRACLVAKGPVRQMSGHKKTIDMVPTNFEWRKFKDHAHFYVLLGAIPIVGIIGATNLFIGPAELADIPEDYEPKHWEYYKHPISRFISRYLVEQQEKIYERHLHFVAIEQEKIQLRKLESKVKHLIDAPSYRYDSKQWYYTPVHEKATFTSREAAESLGDETGMK